MIGDGDHRMIDEVNYIVKGSGLEDVVHTAQDASVGSRACPSAFKHVGQKLSTIIGKNILAYQSRVERVCTKSSASVGLVKRVSV